MELAATFAACCPGERSRAGKVHRRGVRHGRGAPEGGLPKAEPKKAPVKKKPAAPRPQRPPGTCSTASPSRGRPSHGECSRESGTVVVRGEIFAVESRDIPKVEGAVLQFRSHRPHRLHARQPLLRKKDDKSVIAAIKKACMWRWRATWSSTVYIVDFVIEPRSIVAGQIALRQDKAVGDKRVELHLHTRYSTLDALTDPAAWWPGRLPGGTRPWPSRTTAWPRPFPTRGTQPTSTT